MTSKLDGPRANWMVRIITALSILAVAIPTGLWAYERYQTQQMLNKNVSKAADRYADAMRNLNDELERFENQP